MRHYEVDGRALCLFWQCNYALLLLACWYIERCGLSAPLLSTLICGVYSDLNSVLSITLLTTQSVFKNHNRIKIRDLTSSLVLIFIHGAIQNHLSFDAFIQSYVVFIGHNCRLNMWLYGSFLPFSRLHAGYCLRWLIN